MNFKITITDNQGEVYNIVDNNQSEAIEDAFNSIFSLGFKKAIITKNGSLITKIDRNAKVKDYWKLTGKLPGGHIHSKAA